jgi:hypothetical protein
MPLAKSRYDHMKLYRPNGARYAHGRTLDLVEAAVQSAFDTFRAEFGGLPRQDETFIEILGVTGGWAATVLEIKE